MNIWEYFYILPEIIAPPVQFKLRVTRLPLRVICL